MLPRRAIGPSTPASASFLDIAFISFSTGYTRQMDFIPPPLGEWLRTPACRSEGTEIHSRDGYARKSADSARDYLGAARLKIDYRVMWRGVRARAQRCADKDRSPARP